MKIKELETLKTQATALGVKIDITNYDVNRYSIVVKGHSYTNFHSALSAITTIYLKSK